VPIPTTILCGFLGSGKTTLLNALLRGDHGLRVAVIVNEFGSVGVDASVVAGGEQFVELDNGCLCCALNEDLERLLRGLMARGGFDHLVIETTGLADPLLVAWIFTRPGLCDYFRVDAIITLFDVLSGPDRLTDTAEARLQITRADLVVLNKLDLVAEGVTAEEAVRQHNAYAGILAATPGDPAKVPWPLLLSSDEPSRFLGRLPGHHHADFETWTFLTDALLDDAALEDFLAELPDPILRVKGLVRTDATPGWTLVNGVAGRYDLQPLVPSRTPASGCLVFIGRRLDRAALRERCESLVVLPSGP
jgi:G3E family GTPase